MATDTATLAHLCQLARLRLSEEEGEHLAADLTRTIALLDRLAQAPVEGVAPLPHPLELTVALRDDEVTEVDGSAALLALAPSTQGGYYLVPKVLE